MPILTLLLYVIVFAIVAYGLHWVCVAFGMPAPVMWIVGAILLIILLVFIASQTGINLGGAVIGHPIRQ